jgi:hypothetical protein
VALTIITVAFLFSGRGTEAALSVMTFFSFFEIILEISIWRFKSNV